MDGGVLGVRSGSDPFLPLDPAMGARFHISGSTGCGLHFGEYPLRGRSWGHIYCAWNPQKVRYLAFREAVQRLSGTVADLLVPAFTTRTFRFRYFDYFDCCLG